jgi:alkanesulfonate monooxygenase
VASIDAASDGSVRELQLFSTCPQSKDPHSGTYRDRVTEIARWSERAGYRGILVYTDNQLVDPWMVAQLILDATERLRPLVAVQPLYMHPYTVAKKVASIGHLFDRQIDLNMVAGGFRNDLLSLGDDTPHDERYARLIEYALIVKRLVTGERVSVDGRYYRMDNVLLTPKLADELMPGLFVSGSSDAGMFAARAIGATAVKYPKPPDEEVASVDGPARMGIRLGVIARDDDASAWEVALGRFPEDRRGRITHALAMQVSDSQWHRQLSKLGDAARSERNPYWLGPFENYKTFCPYLVGGYGRVAGELARYLRLGFTTFILDIPASEEELEHTAVAFARAVSSVSGEQESRLRAGEV